MSERSAVSGWHAVRDVPPISGPRMPDLAHEDVPRGYKETELGVLPTDWAVCRLRNLLRKAPKYGIAAPATAFDESLPTYIRITDIDDEGRFKPDPPVSINHDIEHDYFLERGDIVFARTGASVGKSYKHRSSNGDLVFAGFLVRVGPDEKWLDSTFLWNYCQTRQYWNWVRSVSLRSGQPGVNAAQYGSLVIPVPPIKEQRAIATALSDADALIESLDRLIAKKRAIKQAAMQQLLTGETRLPGFEGGWERKNFEGVLRRMNVKDYQIQTSDYRSTGRYPVVDQGQEPVIGFTDRAEKVFSCPAGGVIVFGDHTCIVKFVDVDFAVGADGTQILWGRGGISTRFVAYQLEAKGIEPTGYNRHFKFLKEREFVVPTLEEQEAIARTLGDMDAEIYTLERRREKARQIKRGMMQELLTGRTRLVEPQQEAVEEAEA